MKRFLDRLSSLRLGIWLLAYLLTGSILATLIPQGLAEADYYARYPKLVAQLVVQTGLSGFFGSIIFIIPVLIFLANLSTCTIKRLVRQLRSKGRRHHGPDILHVGLILLVVGGIWSYSGHQEGSVTLAPGDSVNLPDGSLLKLVDFQFLRYDDGRPKDWLSIIDIEKDGQVVRDNVELRVNQPLRHAGITFYQASYSELPGLVLSAPDGREFVLAQGEERVFGDAAYFFMAPEAVVMPAAGTDLAAGSAPAASQSGRATAQSGRAILRITPTVGEARTLRVSPGEVLGDFKVVGLTAQLATGIQAVADPGWPLVFLSFMLIALGTAVTFIQKLKEGV